MSDVVNTISPNWQLCGNYNVVYTLFGLLGFHGDYACS